MEAFWENFCSILKIPRASGNEEAIRSFLKNRAENVGCQCFVDTVGNLLIKKAAAKGLENFPVVIFQGHMDMVCEKAASVEHDFFTDPIEPIFFEEQGEFWVKAKGTTLGADNGFALAAGLTLIEDRNVQTGALEFLFTVDEECGLTGACGVDSTFIEGSYLINLDSEEENEICVGCAGGKSLFLSLPLVPEERTPLSKQEREKGSLVELTLSGFAGGHSGIDINKNRANALVEICRILKKNLDKNFRLQKLEIKGRHNVIPVEAKAFFYLHRKNIKKISLPKKIQKQEPTAKLEIRRLPLEEEGSLLLPKKSNQIIKQLAKMPYGVVRFSSKKGVVETSLNPAVLEMNNNSISLEISFRSLVRKELLKKVAKVSRSFVKAKWFALDEEGYPPWEPQYDSELLKRIEKEWTLFSGKKAKVKVIHAGLECGVLKDKLPSCQMISLGPDLVDVHTPREKMNVASAERIMKFLYQILQKSL